MQIIETEKIPIKIWTDHIDDEALVQAKNLANHPFAFHHIAIMPDVHVGYGMPIGGVLATDGVVIPNAVGVDIGCGMCAVKTSAKNLSKNQLISIMSFIRASIPLGFNRHKHMLSENYMPSTSFTDLPIVTQEYNNARKQVGTLGGGNHFIDLLTDTEGFVWIMIHSGSRNIGLKVAEHYNKLAISLRDRFGSAVPLNHQLDYLPVTSEEGDLYIKEMQYCVDFALKNRELMMEVTKECIRNEIKSVRFEPMINIAHNYASLERHFGKDVWVHRKGATSARKGEIGIIPGSQGTNSYIVSGKGEKESFESCSHGAGRKMSRSKAIKKLDFARETKLLESKGILHGLRHKTDLDEAPSVYKNIKDVMEFQSDLVDIVAELSPVAVVKG